MKKHKFLFVIPFLFVLSNSIAQQKIWNINDCFEYAIKHNLRIQQQELDLQDADLNKSDAFGAFLPDLNGRIDNNWSRGFSQDASGILRNLNTRRSSYSIGAGVPIYNGLRNYNRYQRAKLQKVANQYNIESIKDDIRINIANSYLQILLQQENLEVLIANNKVTQQQIERTQKLIDAGSLPKGDILELQANSANELQRIAESENSVAIAKVGLKQLLALNFNEAFAIEKIETTFNQMELIETPLDHIVEEVLGSRNVIKEAAQNVVIAEQNIKIAKGGYLPTLRGNISYSSFEVTRDVEGVDVSNPAFFDQLNDQKSLRFGLSLNVPIFSRFQNKNSVARSKVNVLRSQYRLEQAKQRVSQAVYEVYLDAKASQKSYEAAQLAVVAQEKAYEYAQNRFEVGVSNAFDFSQAKIRYQNSQTQLIRSKYDLLFKLKLLELYYNKTK